VSIKLIYIEILDVALNKFWKFSIGNTLSSRSIGTTNPTENLLKACNPEMISKLDKKAYPWFIDIEIKSPSNITFIDSPTHPINLELDKNNSKNLKVSLDISKEFFPDKEFVLLFRNEEVNKPSISVEYNKNDENIPYAAYVSFFPDFNEGMSTDEVYNTFLSKEKLKG